MKNINSLRYYIIITIGIIIVVNFLSYRFFFRVDLTEDNRYTLSHATKKVLQEIDQPVTIKAYFSEELPPQLSETKREFEELLVEYANLSSGMVMYEFIDPSESEEIANEAKQAGIPPLQVQVRKDDKFEAMVCYLGASIQCGDMQPEVLPQIANIPLEYNLTSAIKKLSVVEKPKIGFLQGHGEPVLSNLSQAKAQLDVLYDVQSVELNDTADNLSAYSTLAIVAPKDSFPQSHLDQLTRFLETGKSIFVAINRVNGDLQNGSGSLVNTGLENWLLTKGISVGNDFVIDASCSNVGVVRNMNGFRMQQQVPFPYIPIIKEFNDQHPVSKGVEAAIFQFASSINYTGDTSFVYTPLAVTSEKSGTENAPLYFNVEKRWTEQDFGMKNLTIAAALEGKMGGTKPSKMVVFSDGDFAVNGEERQGQQLNEDNVNLLVNSIDWLSDDTGLIDLRTKGATSRPLDEVEDASKAFIKWINFLLPIILIVIIGVVRWQYQNTKRIKRMQPGYVK